MSIYQLGLKELGFFFFLYFSGLLKDIIHFIKVIRIVILSQSKPMKSKLFKSLFQKESTEMLYVHVTPAFDVVNSMLQSGFNYDDVFQKTEDQLINK